MFFKKCLSGAVLAFLIVVPTFGQRATISDKPLSDRIVSYTMDVTLEPESHTVRGTEHVTWRNPDRSPVDELQFHLYLNAFESAHSTFMRESGGQHRGFSAHGDHVRGGINVNRLQLVPAHQGDAVPLTAAPLVDLTDRITFIQPDDNNADDRTVISVKLPRAVAPGETIALDIDFTSKLPKLFSRTGWQTSEQGNTFFMVAQWFPKLGVYEIPGQRYVPADAPHGQWNTHQFHENSEFYADFGTYDVTMTVPDGYTVGASGVRVNELMDDVTRTLTYHADDVHDFAWTASPDYLEFHDTWRHVNIRLLMQPQHRAQVKRHFEAVKAALERFDTWVGPYPYTTLTLVDGLGGANGMEYPTLITCGFTHYGLPAWIRAPESVTIHEFGHQYFYGMLASNEFEEAWLDEGINSYMETRIMDDAYGPGSVLDLPFARINDGEMQRISYTKSHPDRGAIFTKSWKYAFSSDYGKASYAKPATVLNTLERYLGWNVMHDILQTYYARWRFRHPSTRDFIAVAEEVSGQDLGWFFDQFVYGTVVVDDEVDAIVNKRIPALDSTAEVTYKSEVRIHRKRDGIFPQKLLVRFGDGSEQRLGWDGRDEWKSFTFDQPIEEAYLDPENVVWLDVNRLNNRKAVASDNVMARKEQLRFTTLLQQVFYLVAGLL